MKLWGLAFLFGSLVVGCGPDEEKIKQAFENNRYEQAQREEAARKLEKFAQDCRAARGVYWPERGCVIECEEGHRTIQPGEPIPEAASRDFLRVWNRLEHECRVRNGRFERPKGCFVQGKDGSEVVVLPGMEFP